MRLGPVYLQVSFHGLNHVVNQAGEKRLVIDRGKILRDGVIERQLFRGQIQFICSLLFAQFLFADLQHHPDHGRRVDEPVVILPQRRRQHFAEGTVPGEVILLPLL